jgi:glutamate-ammonia-ligase adenylyltransferase
MALEAKLEDALGASPLRARLATAAAPLVERRARDAAAEALEGAALAGVARAIASSPESARYLAHRPALLERLARLAPGSLEARAAELEGIALPDPDAGLEDWLDALRLLRRDEMLFAACVGFAGLAEFDAVSDFLSRLAETCMRRALVAAEGRDKDAPPGVLAVLGMGKLAGREFTFHSDLDVIFLYRDDAPDALRPSRVAQRWISYVSTMTAAGFAYAVDSRLRPSGQQGALVTTHEAFARYQTTQAATWEHLALLRARAVAGDVARAQSGLEAMREQIVRAAANPWSYVGDMRGRVVAERGVEDGKKSALKAGRGGIMDVEFLAAGALLERGLQLGGAALPAVPAMLRAALPSPRVENVVADYALLRRVEACARWLAGRAQETIPRVGESAELVADLLRTGMSAAELGANVDAARARIASAFEAVAARATIDALADPARR